jgi:hypothetical protein
MGNKLVPLGPRNRQERDRNDIDVDPIPNDEQSVVIDVEESRSTAGSRSRRRRSRPDYLDPDEEGGVGGGRDDDPAGRNWWRITTFALAGILLGVVALSLAFKYWPWVALLFVGCVTAWLVRRKDYGSLLIFLAGIIFLVGFFTAFDPGREIWRKWFGKEEVIVGTPGTPPSTPVPTTTRTASIPPDEFKDLVLKTNAPDSIAVRPGWRWDLIGDVPIRGWTTDNGYLDARGNRIQVFEVVSPLQEIRLRAKISYCTTRQMCAW